MTMAWQDLEARLRPFVARRVAPPDVDDVLQDVFVRMHRGVGALRDEDRLTAWVHQVARSAIADHGRARARHPLPGAVPPEPAAPPPDRDADREAASQLAGCVAAFVAQLASPYREAVTLVELEGLTIKDAAELAGISVSGMKSRVQRGRARLRELFEDCCEIALDARGKVTDFEPRRGPTCARTCPPGTR